jgi:hypothetical protein
MTFYREASAASPDLVGAARVQFPTAAKSHSKPILAMNARVGFETVPAYFLQLCGRLNEDRELQVSQNRNQKNARVQVSPFLPAALSLSIPQER